MSPPIDRQAALDEWSRLDRAIAVHSGDREVVDGSAALRALIADRVNGAGVDDELFDACAMLGRFFADRGGSPTLAAGTIGHAAKALGATNAAWLAAAGGALAEGYASALVEAERRAALATWEFPGCSVALGDATFAIAAGYPSDDEELLGAWAARVAKAAVQHGARTAIVSGPERPRAAVTDALALVGVRVQGR